MKHRPPINVEKEVELFRLIEDPRICSYLPDKTASLEYRLIAGAGAGTCQMLISRGWRRFGIQFFRPMCPRCSECRSLRVVVGRFRPSKSQRRCLKRNSEIKVRLVRPEVSIRHIQLYNAFHQDMNRRKGWQYHPIGREAYIESFVMGAGTFGHEMQYHADGRMVGVGLIDILPAGISSIYFYHDPAWRRNGPGTFSILQEIRLAGSLGKPYLYLGYCIRENPSMHYKSRFIPHECLDRYVEDEDPPSWRTPEPSSPA